MKMLPLHLLLYKMVVTFQPCETLAGFLLGKPLRVGGTLAVSPGKGFAKLGTRECDYRGGRFIWMSQAWRAAAGLPPGMLAA